MNLKELQAAKEAIEKQIESAVKPKMPKEKVKLGVKRDGDFFYLFTELQNLTEIKECQKRQFETVGYGDCIPEKQKGMRFVLSRSGKLVSIGGGWLLFKSTQRGMENVIELTESQLALLEKEIFPREIFDDKEVMEVVG